MGGGGAWGEANNIISLMGWKQFLHYSFCLLKISSSVERKSRWVWNWGWRDVETGDAEFNGLFIVARDHSSEAVGAPLHHNEIWVAGPLQSLVALSVTCCYLSNASFDFFLKYWLIMGAKKDDLMWKPYGPSFCTLLCTLELDYSHCFAPQIFIKSLSLATCMSHCSKHSWVGKVSYEIGFCPWWVNSIFGEACLPQMESISVQPKWEHDLI